VISLIGVAMLKRCSHYALGSIVVRKSTIRLSGMIGLSKLNTNGAISGRIAPTIPALSKPGKMVRQ
jgi:hypothetical protein